MLKKTHRSSQLTMYVSAVMDICSKNSSLVVVVLFRRIILTTTVLYFRAVGKYYLNKTFSIFARSKITTYVITTIKSNRIYTAYRFITPVVAVKHRRRGRSKFLEVVKVLALITSLTFMWI